MPADRLLLQGITAPCRLGVYDWEQANPQTVWIDVEVGIDVARAASGDDVRDAVDYAALVERVKRIAQARSYRLMETLAEAVAAAALDVAGPRVRVRVTKRALPGIDAAIVEIERTQTVARARPRDRRRGRKVAASRR